MGAGIFMAAFLLSAIYLLATAVFFTKRARWYRREARLERTRSLWGEARRELFDLVRQEKLSPHSNTFIAFYEVQTEILRRPQEYEFISRQLQEGGLAPSAELPMPTWWQERAQWPQEFSSVLHKMNEGIASIVACYRPNSEVSRLLQQRFRGLPTDITVTRSSQNRATPVRTVLRGAEKTIRELEEFAASQPSSGTRGSGFDSWKPEPAF